MLLSQKNRNSLMLMKEITERKNNSMKKRKIKNLPLYIMMVPGLIYLFVNNYIPLAGLVIAFKKLNYNIGIFKSPWVGFKNFEFLFKTKDAFIIFRNTIGYNFVFIVLGTIFSLIVAILLSEVTNKIALKGYQTIILIPFLLSSVLISYIVYAFLATDTGFINNGILEALGKKPISWYSKPAYWPVILTIVYLWKSFGYTTILYYASIIGIDRTYYEAAVVDGASVWKQIKSITLPLLKPTVVTLVLLSIGKMFYSDFGLFYQVPMDNGLLYNATNTIDTYVFRGLLVLNDVGRSSAAGFIQSVLGFIMVLGANTLTRKIDKENALF